MCIEQGRAPCQRIPGAGLDRAIGALLVERMTPEALALTLAVQEQIIQREEEAQCHLSNNLDLTLLC